MQRFRAQFINGFHVVFDTHRYENVDVLFLEKEAISLANHLNTRKEKQ